MSISIILMVLGHFVYGQALKGQNTDTLHYYIHYK